MSVHIVWPSISHYLTKLQLHCLDPAKSFLGIDLEDVFPQTWGHTCLRLLMITLFLIATARKQPDDTPGKASWPPHGTTTWMNEKVTCALWEAMSVTCYAIKARWGQRVRRANFVKRRKGTKTPEVPKAEPQKDKARAQKTTPVWESRRQCEDHRVWAFGPS